MSAASGCRKAGIAPLGISFLPPEETPSSDNPGDNMEIDDLLTWIAGEFRGCSGGGWTSALRGCGKGWHHRSGDLLMFLLLQKHRVV